MSSRVRSSSTSCSSGTVSGMSEDGNGKEGMVKSRGNSGEDRVGMRNQGRGEVTVG